MVVPVLNEEVGIGEFLDKKLKPVLVAEEAKGKKRFEVIVVDDGSKDHTLARIKATELYKKGKVRIVVFTRNFGKELALTAGIRAARGKAVILIDGDGQHPAEAIPQMLAKWTKGAEIVKAVRKRDKTDKHGHRLGSRLYYWLSRRLKNVEVREGEMDFMLLDQMVVKEFVKFTEHRRITRGLIDYLGFEREYVEVRVDKRIGGASSYKFNKLVALAIDSIVSNSRMPLALLGILGGAMTLVSLVLGLFMLIQQYLMNDPLGLDWDVAVAMSLFMAFLVGIVLIGQAITGSYVSQAHLEVMNRPLYVIDRKRSRGLNKTEKDEE